MTKYKLSALLIITLYTVFIPVHCALHQADPYLLWNSDYDASRCSDPDTAITIKVSGKLTCIRYFSAGRLDYAKQVLLVLYGDKDKNDHLPPEQIPNNTAKKQISYAQKQFRRYHIPIVIIARPGTYGSNGRQNRKRFKPEYIAVNLAISALQAKYHFKKIVLLGHSGGATLGAGLLTLGRTDIACYVLTSGAYDLDNRSIWFRKQRNMNPYAYPKGRYDPLKHTVTIKTQPDTRVFLIGNRQDTRTGYQFQEKMQQALLDRGIHAHMISADAYPPDYHNLKNQYGYRCAKQCAEQKNASCLFNQ